LVVGEIVESDVDLAASMPDRFQKLDGPAEFIVPMPEPEAVVPIPPLNPETVE
jgi:hypothetical protein